MIFIRFSHDGVTLDDDRGVSTAIRLVFLRRRGRLRVAICSTLVRCFWCISIVIIIPDVRWCSLIGPLFCCLIVSILAWWISIPLSLLMRRYKRFMLLFSKNSIFMIPIFHKRCLIFHYFCHRLKNLIFSYWFDVVCLLCGPSLRSLTVQGIS